VKYLTLISCFFLSTISFSQDKGVIRFAVDVDNGYFEILLNDTLLIKQYRDTLPIGHYDGVVWSSGYEAKEISFDVGPGENGMLHVKMKHNQAFFDNIQESISYDKKRHLFKHVPVAVIFLGLATSAVTTHFLRKSRDALDLEALKYGSIGSLWAIRQYKANFITQEKGYNRLRTLFYGGIIVSATTFVGAIFTFRYFNKNIHYSNLRENSPWNDKFSLNFGPNNFHLTYDL
jgi:hypothetical protein